MGAGERILIENKVSWSTLFQALSLFFGPFLLLIVLVAFAEAEWSVLAILVGAVSGFVILIAWPMTAGVYALNAPDMIYTGGVVEMKRSFGSTSTWSLKDLYWYEGGGHLHLTKERNWVVRKVTYLICLGHVPYFMRIPAKKLTEELRSHLSQEKRLPTS